MPWQAITYVSSGFTLVAFIIAVAAWVLKHKYDKDRKLIETATDKDKFVLIEKALDLVHIDTERLSQEQMYHLAMELIKRRAQRFRTVAFVVCFLALCSMSFSFLSNSKLNDVFSKTANNDLSSVVINILNSNKIITVKLDGKEESSINFVRFENVKKGKHQVIFMIEKKELETRNIQIGKEKQIELNFDLKNFKQEVQVSRFAADPTRIAWYQASSRRFPRPINNFIS